MLCFSPEWQLTFRAFDLVSLEIQKLYTAFDLNA